MKDRILDQLRTIQISLTTIHAELSKIINILYDLEKEKSKKWREEWEGDYNVDVEK